MFNNTKQQQQQQQKNPKNVLIKCGLFHETRLLLVAVTSQKLEGKRIKRTHIHPQSIKKKIDDNVNK